MATFRGAVAPPGDSLPRPAEVTLRDDAIVATLPDGRSFVVPFDGVALQADGDGGRTLFCRTADRSVTIVSDDPAFERSLRAAGRDRVGGAFARLDSERSAGRRARRTWSLVGATLIAAVVFTAWWFPTRGVQHLAMALPISVDQSIGNHAIEQMDVGTVIHRPLVDAALGEIVDRLAAHPARQGFTFHFRVVDRDVVNAFALPGGQIVVFSGLLRRADAPDEVAGVLGHEMAHVTLRHGIQGLVRAVGFNVALRLVWGDAGALVDSASATAMTAALNGYSRGQEAAADEEGARMAAAAGFDPHGLVRFFTMLRTVPGTELPGILSWASDHPQTDDRIRDLDALIPRLAQQPIRPLSVPWSSVRAAL